MCESVPLPYISSCPSRTEHEWLAECLIAHHESARCLSLSSPCFYFSTHETSIFPGSSPHGFHRTFFHQRPHTPKKGNVLSITRDFKIFLWSEHFLRGLAPTHASTRWKRSLTEPVLNAFSHRYFLSLSGSPYLALLLSSGGSYPRPTPTSSECYIYTRTFRKVRHVSIVPTI